MRVAMRLLVVVLVLTCQSILAQIPKILSYQGILADTSGNAVADGHYNLTFRIYNAVNGIEIWTETQNIEVTDGIFNVILGSATPLNLPFDQPYWLGITVEGSTELSPRIELTSVPYSLEPDSGSGGDGYSLDAADGDPVDAVYVDNDGKVGIGTTIPYSKLDIRGAGPDDGVTFNIGNSDATHFLGLFGGRQNYPNPFNPSTNVEFGIPNSEFVILKVYDLLGREVKTLMNRNLIAGEYQVLWDGTDDTGQAVVSGV